MGFFNLGGLKHLGSKIIGGVSHGLNHIRHMGESVYNKAKSIPVVGDLVAGGLEKLYNTPVLGGFSARNAFETANKAVEVGKGLFSDNPSSQQKSLDAIKNVGARAVRGEYGTNMQSMAQKGTEAVDKLKNIVS